MSLIFIGTINNVPNKRILELKCFWQCQINLFLLKNNYLYLIIFRIERDNSVVKRGDNKEAELAIKINKGTFTWGMKQKSKEEKEKEEQEKKNAKKNKKKKVDDKIKEEKIKWQKN